MPITSKCTIGDIINAIVVNQCDINTATTMAALSGDLTVLKWAVDSKYPLTTKTFTICAMTNATDCAEYLHQNKCPYDDNIWRVTIEENCGDMFATLLRLGITMPNNDVPKLFLDVAKHDRFDMLSQFNNRIYDIYCLGGESIEDWIANFKCVKDTMHELFTLKKYNVIEWICTSYIKQREPGDDNIVLDTLFDIDMWTNTLSPHIFFLDSIVDDAGWMLFFRMRKLLKCIDTLPRTILAGVSVKILDKVYMFCDNDISKVDISVIYPYSIKWAPPYVISLLDWLVSKKITIPHSVLYTMIDNGDMELVKCVLSAGYGKEESVCHIIKTSNVAAFYYLHLHNLLIPTFCTIALTMNNVDMFQRGFEHKKYHVDINKLVHLCITNNSDWKIFSIIHKIYPDVISTNNVSAIIQLQRLGIYRYCVSQQYVLTGEHYSEIIKNDLVQFMDAIKLHIKWYTIQNINVTHPSGCTPGKLIATYGSLKIAVWFLDLDIMPTFDMWKLAIHHNHLPLLEVWWHRRVHTSWAKWNTTEFCTTAAQYNQLPILIWLRETCKINWSSEVYSHAITNNYMDIIKYAVDNKCPPPTGGSKCQPTGCSIS